MKKVKIQMIALEGIIMEIKEVRSREKTLMNSQNDGEL